MRRRTSHISSGGTAWCPTIPLSRAGRSGRVTSPTKTSRRSGSTNRALYCSSLQWRVFTGVYGLRKKPLFIVGPELADRLVGLDRRVDELAVLLLTSADEDIADHVAEMIKVKRAARGVGERDRAHCLHQHLSVIRSSTGPFKRRFGNHAVAVQASSIRTGHSAIVADAVGYEALIARGVEIDRVGRRRNHPYRLIP